ncbi:MAG: metallopeptidase family protein [Chloroflexi bacterium]|nr:metallopeptidase family protein [Chloroflexota bacterium]
MDNLDVVVRDWPRPEHLEERGRGDRYSLLGLYQGVPLTERSHYDLALPDVITIFRHPIEALCATRREVVEEVRKTVLHEIAHHFGMDETALEKTKYT